MPYRYIPCATAETYHIFNRSIASQTIFSSSQDRQRMVDLFTYYRFSGSKHSFSCYNRLSSDAKQLYMEQLKQKRPLLVTLFAFAIMPTHIHLVLRQEKNNGISTFMSCVQNGYAKYFNLCHKRYGAMFQSMYKTVHIESEEQYLHTIRYVHLNPMTSRIVSSDEELITYPWTSLPDYFSENTSAIVDTSWMSERFKTPDSFRQFIFDQAEYQRSLSIIKVLDE